MLYLRIMLINVKMPTIVGVLARLHLGHRRDTHSYLLQGEEQPQCVGCDEPLTVCHFLLECGDIA